MHSSDGVRIISYVQDVRISRGIATTGGSEVPVVVLIDCCTELPVQTSVANATDASESEACTYTILDRSEILRSLPCYVPLVAFLHVCVQLKRFWLVEDHESCVVQRLTKIKWNE